MISTIEPNRRREAFLASTKPQTRPLTEFQQIEALAANEVIALLEENIRYTNGPHSVAENQYL